MYYHGQTLLVRAVKEEWISPPALSFIHAHVSTVHVYHFHTTMISQKTKFNLSRQNNCDSQM